MANLQILVHDGDDMFSVPIQYPNKKSRSNTMLFIMYVLPNAFIRNNFNCIQGIHNLTHDLAVPNTMFYHFRYWIGFSTTFFYNI